MGYPVLKYLVSPGSGSFLVEPYKESREAFFSYSKPRTGIVHELMKKARVRYKYAQNYVLRNEIFLCADALASKHPSGDIICFWKKVKKYNSGNVASSNRIENKT